MKDRKRYTLHAARLTNFLSLALIASIHAYQTVLRPLLPTVCRFQPSCSEFFIQAVQKYGPWRGSWKGITRICRCHPWHPGGYDPP